MSDPDHTQFEFIELFTIMHALNTEYRVELGHGTRCRTFAVTAEGDPEAGTTPEEWLKGADSSDSRRAAIEAIVAKMPQSIRFRWNEHRAQDGTAVAA